MMKPILKWLGAIILAGTMLILALVGGKWGTSYSAIAYITAAPIIDNINPHSVRMGSADTLMVINGSNFGTLVDTGVRILDNNRDLLLEPDVISPNQISVVITSTLLTRSTIFTITVIKTTDGSPPTIPTIPNPPDEEISNPVHFLVWSPDTYLTHMHKNSR